jgi:FKBP-type peptidyl-prolyl cis-trans isomerase (trigger factor)
MGGPAAAKAAAAEVLLNDTLPDALGPFSETAISGSEAVTDNIDALAASLDPASPFTYHVGFDTLPPVVWTGSYKGLALEVAAAGEDGVDVPARAAAQLLAARKEKGALRVSASVRPAAPALAQGDAAVIDFDLVEAGSGASIPGAARAGMQVDTDLLGAALGLPGLVPGMLGMAPGESREVGLTMPVDWADPPHLAGAAVTAKVTVRDVLAWELPEPSDAWADGAFPGSPPGLAGLLSRFADALAAEDATATALKVEDALADAVGAAVGMAVPESVIQEVGQEAYQAELLQAASSGGIAASQVAQLATPALLARFIAARRDQLAAVYRAQAGMDAIFEAEGLAIDADAVEGELAAARAAYADAGEELDEERLLEQVTSAAQRRATLDWLKANNEVVVGPPARPRRAFRAA